MILFPESPESADPTPAQWNKIVANNPSFAFLHDPEEDIYILEDGIAVSYEGGCNLTAMTENNESSDRLERLIGDSESAERYADCTVDLLFDIMAYNRIELRITDRDK